MLPTHSGAIRLFRFSGIQVYLHWSWFVVALIEYQLRAGNYRSPLWNIAEYLSLFGIVLLHEFGHSLACRQVGGKADEIILWPLGGVAFVSPPMRPGPVLWSIAAGPLVNVVLAPILFGLVWLAGAQGWTQGNPDLAHFLVSMAFINAAILVFNLLPIYPLDGGQILQSLLWYWVGRARSLFIVSIIGFVGVAALAGFAIYRMSIWTGIMAFFLGQRCWSGYQSARTLAVLGRVPRHVEFSCPSCREAPPAVPIWLCAQCGQRFDPFAAQGRCPQCHAVNPDATCAFCHHSGPVETWAPRGRSGGLPPVIDV